MDYAEELAYWYLRLNGFFPITNFVVHRSEQVKFRSDMDVLAVRPPHVYEVVGGQNHDWDAYLTDRLPFNRSLGILCEVKTGDFEENKLFRDEYVGYALPRLGLVPVAEADGVAKQLSDHPSVQVADGAVVAKLLISQEEIVGPYLNRTLGQVEDFLKDRVDRYSVEKYASRMFFPSKLFQHLIEQVNRAVRSRSAV